ncbi:hypothetical protein D3869_18165 (plasmid) [Azospirillum brasilense]|uniref:Uncharacterized protein n=1 Tax=Azospirillum brasilense TaxID=192 RepID=A0A4D8R984_AZOBR|nr:hypothetical protein D3869_18165 [Azospirillum brasilense]
MEEDFAVAALDQDHVDGVTLTVLNALYQPADSWDACKGSHHLTRHRVHTRDHAVSPIVD